MIAGLCAMFKLPGCRSGFAASLSWRATASWRLLQSKMRKETSQHKATNPPPRSCPSPSGPHIPSSQLANCGPRSTTTWSVRSSTYHARPSGRTFGTTRQHLGAVFRTIRCRSANALSQAGGSSGARSESEQKSTAGGRAAPSRAGLDQIATSCCSSEGAASCSAPICCSSIILHTAGHSILQLMPFQDPSPRVLSELTGVRTCTYGVLRNAPFLVRMGEGGKGEKGGEAGSSVAHGEEGTDFC